VPEQPSPDAIFDREGDRFLPTAAAIGPWDPNALHGGPVAMLLARGIESVDSGGALDVVRLTVELLRPVSVTPLALSAEIERPGRRVQLIGAALTQDGVEVARARALRVRRADLGVETPGEPPPPGPADLEPRNAFPGLEAYFTLGVELRGVQGDPWSPGPATMWVRLKLPVVAGEEPTPLQRVAAAADFGNGISSVLDWTKHVFINPDLTIHLLRQPVGQWVAMDSRTEIGPGYGLAQSTLYDERGEIGRSLQSLYVDNR
jgi:acyl-Coa thioesterase superfamily protein/acyl-CoA thioesterase superfamily protein